MAKTRASKAEPFSIRLTHATDRFVAAEARRTHRSKSAIVEMLTEEAARIRRFPGIGFRGDDAGRRAWVIGTTLDVWQIIEALESAGGVEELVRTSELDERQIRLAIAYRDHHPEEIAEAIDENARPLDELRELYPFVAVEPID
jgi:uncharacterized protein (DUF433 family)